MPGLLSFVLNKIQPKRFIWLLVLLQVFSVPASAQAFDHSEWDTLLGSHVTLINEGVASVVDYDGFQQDKKLLEKYLDDLSSVDEASFNRLAKAEQLAFLINIYNAQTVALILTEYPALASIRDLGSLFRSPWKRKFIPLFGEIVSLDHIEHNLIRKEGVYDEPRIHFAVNCASVGCPALHNEAYTGEKLAVQLETAAAQFLKDRSRNRLEENTLRVSMIFNWYEEDFDRLWGDTQGLTGYFVSHAQALGLDEEEKQKLINEDINIEFLDYDWTLNKDRP